MIDCSLSLIGKDIALRPIRATDFEALHSSASDPLIWEQHPDPLRYEREAFRVKFFDPAVAGNMAYVVVDHASGELIGSSRYYEHDEAKREIAIGYTFLSKSHWGGLANRDMKKLMLDHAFASGINRVWFHVGKSNMRSRRAMEKIGGQFSHEGVKEMAGLKVDYVFFTIDKPKV
jgi:RimJ/RimL family protein N-acetyltransferase